MLSYQTVERVLAHTPHLTVGVLGDLFLDRYLEIDAGLTEVSIETGLDAYQVTQVRSIPGAAGTVINNLAALGVGRIIAISVIGDDGEGYELSQALAKMPAVDRRHILTDPGLHTPTYTKPMLHQSAHIPRELSRLDIKNRRSLPTSSEVGVLQALDAVWPTLDALLVLDQVSEPECGVVTTGVRQRLAEFAERDPTRIILADSRDRTDLFRSVYLKPNELECTRAVRAAPGSAVEQNVGLLAQHTGRPVFCTCGPRGICVLDPTGPRTEPSWAAAYPVRGPIDVVGAGDSTSAGIACALAAGTSLVEAAAFGNLIASITVQQIGTTGTAAPDQVRQRWRDVSAA
jgi:rfaE bifunctional protein kinase chain/domain